MDTTEKSSMHGPKRTIWKFELMLDELLQQVMMPKGSRPLSVQLQGDKACLWALVDPANADQLSSFRFWIFDTGDHIFGDIITKVSYLTTLQVPKGAVVHVFVENESAT